MKSRSSQAVIPFSRKSADLLPEDIAIIRKDFSHEIIAIGIFAAIITGVSFLMENFYLLLLPVAMAAYTYFKSYTDISAGTKNVITGIIDSKFTQTRRQKRRNILTYFFIVGGEKWEVTQPDYVLFEEGDIIELHATVSDKVFCIKKVGEQKQKPVLPRKRNALKLYIPERLGTLVKSFKATDTAENYPEILQKNNSVNVLKHEALPPVITNSSMTAEEIAAVTRERNLHTAYLTFLTGICIILYNAVFPFLDILTEFVPMGDTLLFLAIGLGFITMEFLPYQHDIREGRKEVISTIIEEKKRISGRKEGVRINGMQFSSTKKTHQITANGRHYNITQRQYADCRVGQSIDLHIAPLSKMILNIQTNEN